MVKLLHHILYPKSPWLILMLTVRDEWEAKKAGVEEEVSTLFGTPWTFDINPNAIYPYAEENSYGSNSLGACIMRYAIGP